MVSNKLWKTGTISFLILFLGSLGVNVSTVLDDDGYIPYECDKESVPDLLCYKLSRVNDNGIQRNCYYDRDNSKKYKICSTGWGMLPPDEVNIDCKPIVLKYTEDGKYFCDDVGVNANCIKDETLEMSFE